MIKRLSKYLIILFLFCSKFSISQKNFLQISFINSLLQNNKTLNKLEKEYDYQIKKSNYTINTSYSVYYKKRTSFYLGLSFKKINYKIIDRLSKYTYVKEKNIVSGGSTFDTLVHIFNDPADLNSNSYNIGLFFELKREILSSKRGHHFLGLSNEIYFWEKFNSSYESLDFNKGNPEIVPFTNYYGNLTPFYFHSNSTSIFYNFQLKVNEIFSLSTKITLGTNLYSDWDQFKKYAWLGVGLEVGFGNRALIKKKEH